MNFQVRKWPSAILHIDADAFFATVLQVVRPELRGKPVVAGAERGIATAVSYEARKLGVTRGMRIFEIKRKFPQCIIAHSDYETYSLFSQKIFSIVNRYSPTVEEYGIEEGFADLQGLRRPLGMSYEEMGKKLKEEIERSTGLTVSVGVSLTKSLAKLASNSHKPSGYTVVDGLSIEPFLRTIPVEAIWGVGYATASYMKHLNIKTAFDFAIKNEEFILSHFTKPHQEIWNELHGNIIYMVNPHGKSAYKGITKSQTFTPPSNDENFLWARLFTHVEDAFKKARRYGYNVGEIFIYLKTQQFNYHGTKIKLSEKTSLPFLIHDEIHDAFKKIYKKGVMYRAAGATISNFEDTGTHQAGLFTDQKHVAKVKNLYPLYDQKKIDFGATLFDPGRKVTRTRPLKFSLPFFSVKNSEGQRI